MKTNTTQVSEIGSFIKKARKAQGLTQSDLAGMAGTNRRFISELENGKETAEIGKALHVMSVLGIAINLNTKWMDS